MAETAKTLIDMDLAKIQGIFCTECLILLMDNFRRADVVVGLVAVLNKLLPDLGLLLAKRTFNGIADAVIECNYTTTFSFCSLLGHLLNHHVVDHTATIEILELLLAEPIMPDEPLDPGNLTCAIHLIRVITLLENDEIRHEVRRVVRRLYAIYEERSCYQCLFRGLFVEGERTLNVETLFRVNPELGLADPSEQVTHSLSSADRWGYEVYQEDLDLYKSKAKGSSSKFYDPKGEEMKYVKDLARRVENIIMTSTSLKDVEKRLGKIEMKDGMQDAICWTIITCCIKKRQYDEFYGHLARGYCADIPFKFAFQRSLARFYRGLLNLHSSEVVTGALFYADLLGHDNISWRSLCCIHLRERSFKGPSRKFFESLLKELKRSIGIAALRQRFTEPTL